MESKRRGLFTKSKLVRSLYNRGTKPSSTAVHPHNGKRNKLASVEPKDSTMDLVIVNQEQVYHQPKVAYVVPDRAGRMENFQALCVEDDGVDSKAARYISNVQERFRLEEMQLA
ncbi:hypothetical protein F511_18421 [Dorcoceras hygrometricum]|uniref:Uncharacterized protein n=1 Tax=Dorcoceras hygrometricum TaxID=472368 RepID=A0A2Z7C566_9LAMI|nr:hypothetical protein F511_18421 [Dorcoceras hygrometricum]